MSINKHKYMYGLCIIFFISFGSCTLAQWKGNCGSIPNRDRTSVFFRVSTLTLVIIQTLTKWAERAKCPGLEVDNSAPTWNTEVCYPAWTSIFCFATTSEPGSFHPASYTVSTMTLFRGIKCPSVRLTAHLPLWPSYECMELYPHSHAYYGVMLI
jgi:hypothetical protein